MTAMEIITQHRESVQIQAASAAVYALVSDVTRTGEWSPVCRGCDWEGEVDPQAPTVGDTFLGHNVTPTREWTTRSEVTAADGTRFAWSVGPRRVEWGYEVTAGPTPQTCTLTETWHITQAGLDFFVEKYGERAEAEVAERSRQALSGIPATLA